MSIWDKLKGELIDIVEWLDPTSDTLAYRFERHGNEIKYGAKLVVREGQKAAFVNEGKLADVFVPGTYNLETRNLPILSTLLGWKYGFRSPFKAEVYFVSTRQFTDLKWGTQNPIMLRDAEFGPVRLRAFGTYVIRVTDAGAFIREIVGTDGHFTTGEVTEQLRNLVVSRFADILAESGIPVLELAANYDELGRFVTERLQGEFGKYGLELTNLLVENVSLPQAVEEALDKRSAMGVIGDLSRFTQYQTAEAMRDAAKNEGGLAGGAMAMGLGFAMAQQASQAAASGGAGGAPPPVPVQAFWVAVAGERTGPFDRAVIERKIRAGEVARETLVWRAGLPEWSSAEKIDELRGLFVQQPQQPPQPPSLPKKP